MNSWLKICFVAYSSCWYGREQGLTWKNLFWASQHSRRIELWISIGKPNNAISIGFRLNILVSLQTLQFVFSPFPNLSVMYHISWRMCLFSELHWFTKLYWKWNISKKIFLFFSQCMKTTIYVKNSWTSHLCFPRENF